jgi:transposase
VTGVAVVEVHPAYTSQCCPRCEHVARDNRRGVAFRCVRCGYVAHADVVGARNIARKARGDFPWKSLRPRNKHGRALRPSALSAGVAS